MKSTSTSYQTTGEALEILTKRGFNTSFFIKNGQLHSYASGNEYPPEQATVVQTLRVEGESDPAAMVAIYALQVEDAAEGD